MDMKFTPEEIAKSLRVCAKPNHCEGCAARGHGFQYCDLLFSQAADLIEAQAKRIAVLEEQLRWIPVEERLPSPPEKGKYRPVIVRYTYLGKDFIDALAVHDGESWRWFAVDYGTVYSIDPVDLDSTPITHWMPLPDGPEVGHE